MKETNMKETFQTTHGKFESLKYLQILVEENSIGEKEKKRIRVILERISQLSSEIEKTVPVTNSKKTQLNFTSWCIAMMRRDVMPMIENSEFSHPGIYTTLLNFLSTKAKVIGKKVLSSQQKRKV